MMAQHVVQHVCRCTFCFEGGWLLCVAHFELVRVFTVPHNSEPKGIVQRENASHNNVIR